MKWILPFAVLAPTAWSQVVVVNPTYVCVAELCGTCSTGARPAFYAFMNNAWEDKWMPFENCVFYDDTEIHCRVTLVTCPKVKDLCENTFHLSWIDFEEE